MSALDEITKEVEIHNLRVALVDAIRSPKDVVPESAKAVLSHRYFDTETRAYLGTREEPETREDRRTGDGNS